MSTENQYEPPVGAGINTPPTKKSGGALKWILGGCGCLGLLAALCIGGLVYFSVSSTGAVVQEARTMIEGSSVVKEKLGEPISIDSETVGQGGGAEPALIFDFDVSGPKGSGRAKVTAPFNESTFKFEIEESTLEVDGQTFDLNTENDFKMDLEGLDEDL